MKFTDGFWRKRDGITPLHPAHVQDAVAGTDRLTVYAATKQVRGREDTLNAPVITVTCTSPAPDVIRVTITHFAGERPRHPRFAVQAAPTVPRVTGDSFTSGRLTARFATGAPWELSFEAEGRTLTRSGYKGIGVIDTDGGEHYVHEQLDLGVGEVVYGLGERLGPLAKNGQSIDIWNEDGGTSSEQAYKNIPFHLTNRGYGVFVDHPGLVSYEVGSEVVSRTQFSVAGQSLSCL